MSKEIKDSTSKLAQTNTGIYILSVIGSSVLVFIGLFRGQCVDYCGDTYAEYVSDPTTVAFGISGLLVSTLIFMLIAVFIEHVQRAIK